MVYLYFTLSTMNKMRLEKLLVKLTKNKTQ